MLCIVKFLKANGLSLNLDSMKVHLACWNGTDHPLDVYYAGSFQAWQDWQKTPVFRCEHIVSLIDLGKSEWLFVGVYEVLNCRPHPKHPENVLYTTRLLPLQDDLIGRVIVLYKRPRQSFLWYRPEMFLPIVEIRREKMSIAEFPGYNSVAINHASLKIIIRQRIASWHGALANIKGVYLITDNSTGCHYVGKASGQVGIWQRWTPYAETGHGGNVQLRQLLRTNGSDHASHFQYSILEIADNHASEEDIQARESHWMNVLQTRAFGLN